MQKSDESLEECGIEELYGEATKLPQTEHLWASKLPKIKDRLEDIYRTDRDEFYRRKKMFEQAFKERERGQTRTMPDLSTEGLRSGLKFTNHLYG